MPITTLQGKVQTADLREALRAFVARGRIPTSQVARGFFDQRRFVRYVCIVRLEDLSKAHPEIENRAIGTYAWWLEPIVDEAHFRNAAACRELLLKLDPSWKNEPPPSSGPYEEPEEPTVPSENGFGRRSMKDSDK
ncbi:hypothetical protein KBB96_08780 [Luteolibacter ambystomatis]|uniref:Uncharacterized protein n=1 Tax=Luteolibacter ambystomatis TaxID=2824561 RepID=A0A975J2R5_9BACT|nr:hypothetical protein [Luteolibacter ambystomatis]QUE52972.1 hypothetical protein KBB96_08780 [Luteolibacter ambystomatis]